MMGGLANRMFQYSYALYLATKGYNVYNDNNYKPTKWRMEDIAWDKIFPFAEIRQANKFRIWIYGGGYDLVSKARRKLNLTYKYYPAPTAFTCPSQDEIDGNNYFAGIMHDVAVVSSVKSELLKRFSFSEFEDVQNQQLKQELESCNSVSIHVRKGKDYLIRDVYAGTCDVGYYRDAINYIKKHVTSPKFYLFTDNIEWVKDNMKELLEEAKVIDWNPSVGWGNHFDMQLMSHAKHNIIANSTYSWWGAFLNQHNNKIVIGPKQWFSKTSPSFIHNGKALMPEWVAL